MTDFFNMVVTSQCSALVMNSWLIIIGIAKTCRITRTVPHKSTRTITGAGEFLLGVRVRP